MDYQQSFVTKRRHGARTALFCCFLFYLLLRGTPARALDPNNRLTQYIHTAWRTQDGSMPAGIYHITQTSDGFLWFLSLPGDLYRFDGVRFQPWHLPAAASMNMALNIFADHAGGLWVIGHHDLVRLKNGNVASHFPLEGPMFHGIAEDPDGSLWLVTDAKEAPFCHVTNGVKCFGKADGIPISGIQSLLSDGNGGFWLGGRNGGLVHWHDGTSETYKVASEVFSMARGPDGSLWLGLSTEGPGQGLQLLRDGAVKPFALPPFKGSNFDIGALMFDHDGNLWVGTKAHGIFRVHGNAVEHYDRTNGLSGDSVYALFEDREGIVWAGTTSGVDSFRDPAVVTFSQVEGLGKDLPAGILASRDGTIWVANAGSLDHIVSGSVSSIRAGKGLPGQQVTRMLEDHAGNLWIGVDDGLYMFKNGHFRRLPEPNHQPLGMVFGLIEDTDGNIWAECKGNPPRLIRIRDFRVREEFSATQVPTAWMMAPDPRGGIWIATRKGDLVLFRQNAQQKFPLNPNGKNPAPHRIVAQADGSVLAAYEDGLLEFRDGKVQWMTTKNGLPCNQIISLAQDKEKRWWLYTRCGIVEFADSELQRWWTNPDTIVQNRVFDTFDGAQPNVAAFNPEDCSPDGRVWFTSGIVVQVVNPLILSQKSLPVQTYIESLTADRKEFTGTDKLRLPPHPRDLQIDYTSPTFSIPQKVKFRYRLDGYDHDWHEAGTRRQAFYTDLPAGKYTFRVIAANSDGVWNENAAQLDFSVAPAYYQTNWFRALCAALVLAIAWIGYQLRVRQLRREFNMAIEARVSERTRIARELHDTLLQSLQALLFQYQAARNLFAAGSERAMQVLDATLDRTEQAIAESRDAIHDIRSDNVSQNALPELLTRAGTELAGSRADQDVPTFGLTVEGERRMLTPVIHEEAYRIALELLRNAFRHAKAHRIEAEIRYDDEMLRLRIRDDGKGMDLKKLQEDTSGHWGLRGVRERAERIGAKLNVWSEAGAGTEFELTIPSRIAYSGPADSLPFRMFRKVKGYASRS